MVTGYKSRPGGSHFTQAGAVIIFTNLSGSGPLRVNVFFICPLIFAYLQAFNASRLKILTAKIALFWPFIGFFAPLLHSKWRLTATFWALTADIGDLNRVFLRQLKKKLPN